MKYTVDEELKTISIEKEAEAKEVIELMTKFDGYKLVPKENKVNATPHNPLFVGGSPYTIPARLREEPVIPYKVTCDIDKGHNLNLSSDSRTNVINLTACN